jgi:hypothetical protein
MACGLKHHLTREAGRMGRDQSSDGDDYAIAPIEHQLTMHLERAHELAERAKRANGAAQQEINRAREIADALSDEFAEVPARRRR